MQTAETSPTLRDIVLIGGGHSHVGVLRRFGMRPQPGVRLTLICTDVHTPYSGMLPGYIAGHYSYDQVHIDLSRLCVATGARLIVGQAVGLDRGQRLVRLHGRPALRYDWVSVNVGSTPATMAVAGAAEHAVPVKPIAQFNQRWQALLARAADPATSCLTVAVVGAGAGGVELALALQHRIVGLWQSQARAARLVLHVVSASATVLPTHAPSVQRHFAQLLAQRGVQVHLSAPVTELHPGGLMAGGQMLQADTVLWVTQASGPAWLQDTGLALDAQGCIKVNDHLQSVSDERVFAAGDVASLPGHALEKAGVFAVRMGRPLADNLRAAVRGQPLQTWRPQRRWLALIGTGDARAVASRGAFRFGLGKHTGRWMWAYKDWIDQRFMQRFSPAPGAMQMIATKADSTGAAADLGLDADESAQAISAIAMRCGGCGAKVGATVCGLMRMC
jgi:selenide, water dikinase